MQLSMWIQKIPLARTVCTQQWDSQLFEEALLTNASFSNYLVFGTHIKPVAFLSSFR
jgi:hypothetical protein